MNIIANENLFITIDNKVYFGKELKDKDEGVSIH